jgi:hypothetical protein
VNLYKAGRSRIREEIPMFSVSDGAGSDQLDYDARKTTLNSGPRWQRHNRRREGGGLVPGPSSAGLARERKQGPKARKTGRAASCLGCRAGQTEPKKRRVSLFISSFGYTYFFSIPF